MIDVAQSAHDAAAFTDEPVAAALTFGLSLIHNHYFWEAHEVLEPVWMKASPNSAERQLLQALIQLANACLKSTMGQPQAAARLAQIADDHLQEARGRSGNECVLLTQDSLTIFQEALTGLKSDEPVSSVSDGKLLLIMH